MKNMNWGHGLTFAFIAFASLMIFMAVKAFEQDIALVTADYYKEELAYQNRIDEINNSKQAMVVDIGKSVQGIALTFPVTPESGEVYMYRPSDQRLDRKFALTNSLHEIIPEEQVASGYYILKLHWSDKERSYYQEKGIFVE